MAILICKGTTLEYDAGAGLAAISQVRSIGGPSSEVETFEADYLDNSDAGIPMKPTGRTAGGQTNFELWLDPGLAGHQALVALLETPAVKNWGMTYSDSSAWTFSGTLKSLSPAVELANGLLASGAIELDGLPTYP